MMPATQIRDVKSNGVQARGTFAISMANQAHVMTILRDTLYSDKVLAVLREYSSNAWDAHREAGKGNLPIKVGLPTEIEPTLSIRDFGPGLSEHDIFEVYTQYGASTKRDNNSTVGMLGIGCKSGFCYSDSFTITSWHGGLKSVYVAYLDPSDKGEINRIASTPCGDETGVEIKIAVRSQDIDTFRRKAINLFRYFAPRPDINIDLPEAHRMMTPHGYITDPEQVGYDERNWVAIMGCVPYRLDLSQIQSELGEAGITETVHNVFGGLFFTIGEVQISASREELKYSDKTKAAIVARIQALVDTYVEDMLATLKSDTVSNWDRRLKVRMLNGLLKLPIPKSYKELTSQYVDLYGKEEEAKPKTFVLYSKENTTDHVPVDERLSVYYQDTDKNLRGFDFPYAPAVVLVPVKGATRAEVIAEFEALCLAAQIDGLGTVTDLSSRPWSSPSRKGGSRRTPNKKYHVRTFRLKEMYSAAPPWSDTWEIESREPQDSDVFVVVKDFKCVGWDDFHSKVQGDRALANKLGASFPPIYGYKSTSDKPVAEGSCKGTHYKVWRETFFRSLVKPEYLAVIAAQHWDNMLDSIEPYTYIFRSHQGFEGALLKFETVLGTAHPITEFLRRALSERKAFKDTLNSTKVLATELSSRVKHELENEALKAQEDLLKTYPMLQLNNGLRELVDFSDGDNHVLLDYVKLVDRDREQQAKIAAILG